MSENEIEGIDTGPRDFKDLLQEFRKNRVARPSSFFIPYSERERKKSERSRRRARRAKGAGLREFKIRKIERGMIPITTPSIRPERVFYDAGQRRSIMLILLLVKGEPHWLLLEKTDQKTGRKFLTCPGGKAKSAGEGRIQTVLRETREETGLDFIPEIGSIVRIGTISHGEEGGEVDVFYGVKKCENLNELGLRSTKTHHRLVVLTPDKFLREMGQPGRVSLNACEAVKFLAAYLKKQKPATN